MTPGVSYFAIIHLFLFIDKYYLAVYTPLVMDGVPPRKLYREGPRTDTRRAYASLGKGTTSPFEKRGDRLKTGFIGAGKVGFTLGKYFSNTTDANSIKVTGYYSRNTQSAEEAANFTGSEAFSAASS